jgi:hypothetical protein
LHLDGFVPCLGTMLKPFAEYSSVVCSQILKSADMFTFTLGEAEGEGHTRPRDNSCVPTTAWQSSAIALL